MKNTLNSKFTTKIVLEPSIKNYEVVFSNSAEFLAPLHWIWKTKLSRMERAILATKFLQTHLTKNLYFFFGLSGSPTPVGVKGTSCAKGSVGGWAGARSKGTFFKKNPVCLPQRRGDYKKFSATFFMVMKITFKLGERMHHFRNNPMQRNIRFLI